MQQKITEKTAIESFAMSVTLPILLDLPSGVALLATGTLFKVNDRHMLITARHVFDDLPDLEKLAYPEAPKRGGLHTFGTSLIVKPTDENIDVAVMLLDDPQTVERLNQSWQFLTLQNIAAPAQATPDGHFFVAGYPGSMTKTVGDWLSGAFITAYTQRIPEIPAEAKRPVDPELDLFFDYAKTAVLESGKEVNTPGLPGVSGASIWQARDPASPIWTPEGTWAVVGVQSAYIHSKYIRAKSWWAVAKVLEQIDAQLAATVRAELGHI
jgi:hypothetical protein